MQDGLADAAARALAELSGEAWVIDVGRGRVLAATPAGAAWLGLSTRSPPWSLDVAMPALRRLRELSHQQAGRLQEAERLLFWTALGPVETRCEVERLPAPWGREAVWLVVGHRERDEAVARESSRRDGAAGRGPERDDAATLREIGRRIREGMQRKPALEVAAVIKTGTEGQQAEASEQGRESVAAGSPSDKSKDAERERLARTAHELKTPLSAIAAAAEVIRDQRLGSAAGERYRDYAADIYSSARHALAIVDRILTGSTSEVAALPATADCNVLIRETLSEVTPLAAEAGLKLAADLEAGALPVAVDPTSLKQIVLNLLTNAFKFTSRGGAVTVRTLRNGEAGLTIEIDDTGSGMTKAEIARALAGEALSPPSPRAKGGLGIGLPLVRQLTEASGGRMEIDSTLGEGTTVRLSFGAAKSSPLSGPDRT